MCYHSRLTKTARTLKKHFEADFEEAAAYQKGPYNGFGFPKTPVITNREPTNIRLFQWGLIPSWAQNPSIRQYTLNAKMETLEEKPSFRKAIPQRCLVFADGFFEWQWLDRKGRQKQKYELHLPHHAVFAFAGLWSRWTPPTTRESRYTYTLLTTAANPLMQKIHNSKKRMPVIVAAGTEKEWLVGRELQMDNARLEAEKIRKGQQRLFD